MTETTTTPPVLKDAKRKKPAPMNDLEWRLPPHSVEAEQGVLGCILLSPNECMEVCIEKLKAGAKMFYDLKHQVLYEELLAMYEAKKAIDEITLTAWLKSKDRLQSVGGLEYVMNLGDKVPSAANLTFYTTIVAEKFILRQVVATCADVTADVYKHEGEVDELLDGVERRMLAINMERQSSGILSMKEHISVSLQGMDKAMQSPGVMPGLLTGFRDFDKLTLGLVGGDMCIIAARPSVGKSTLAFNIAFNIAARREAVGVISLEMKGSQLVDREIAARARVDSRRIRTGQLTAEEVHRIAAVSSHLSTLPIHIDDERGINTLQLRAKMRRMVHMYGCRLFIIDYLQLLLSHGRRNENRSQEVAFISNALKTLAGDLDVPVIVLSQLSREHTKGGKNGDKPRAPTMESLRESGSIEQDADEILLLHAPNERDSGDIQNDEDDWIDVSGILAKQRNGAKGDIPFRFYRRFTLYVTRPRFASEDLTDASQWHFTEGNA